MILFIIFMPSLNQRIPQKKLYYKFCNNCNQHISATSFESLNSNTKQYIRNDIRNCYLFKSNLTKKIYFMVRLSFVSVSSHSI